MAGLRLCSVEPSRFDAASNFPRLNRLRTDCVWASFGQGCTLAPLAAHAARITSIAVACAFTGLSSRRGVSKLRVNRSDTKTLSRAVAPHNANVAAALHHRLLHEAPKAADAA